MFRDGEIDVSEGRWLRASYNYDLWLSGAFGETIDGEFCPDAETCTPEDDPLSPHFGDGLGKP